MAKGVSESGGKCRINWRQNGTRYFRTLEEPYTPSGIKKAARIRRQILANFKEGKVDRGPCPTFYDLAQKRLNTLSSTHRRMEKSRLNNYWNYLNDVPVDDINYDDLMEVDLSHLSPKTQKHIYGAASGVFNLAIKSRWITVNPAKIHASEVSLIKREVDPFTREERDKLLNALTGHVHLYYAIRFYCGLRPSEVIALRVTDYDRKTNEFIVNKVRVDGVDKAFSKNKKDRRVPVHKYVRDAMQALPRRLGATHLILTKQHTPYSRSRWLGKALAMAMEQEGIRYRSPYNARHTCATMMLEGEMAPGYCAKILGHSLEMFFKVYADHIDKSQAQKQVEKMEQYL